MKIEFLNINQDDIKQLFSLEEDFPMDIVVRDITDAFDGETALQLITQLGPAVITSLTTIILNILNRKKEKSSTKIIVIFNDGKKLSINNEEDVEKMINHE